MTALDAKCTRVGGITFAGNEGWLCKGVAGMKDMDNLRLACGVDAMDADHAPLHNKETLTGLTFAEKDIRPLSRFITFENELISAIQAERKSCKDLERSKNLNDKMIETRSLRHGKENSG